jgi:DNA-binding CsgD family transcriptional regulator
MSRLTAREREVLALMAEGQANSGIGALLGITEGGEQAHQQHLREARSACRRG